MMFEGEFNLKARKRVRILEDVEINSFSISLVANGFFPAFATISYLNNSRTYIIQSRPLDDFTRFTGKVKAIYLLSPNHDLKVSWKIAVKEGEGDVDRYQRRL